MRRAWLAEARGRGVAENDKNKGWTKMNRLACRMKVAGIGVWKAFGAAGLVALLVVATGCGSRDPLMAKAKAAEKAGNINFFGFYPGMPREDADVLAARYGLQGLQVGGMMKMALDFELGMLGLDGSAMFHENPETHEVYAMLFSFKDVQRLTGVTGTVHDMAQAVADQVGDMEGDGDGNWRRKLANGVTLSLSSELHMCILLDPSRVQSGVIGLVNGMGM